MLNYDLLSGVSRISGPIRKAAGGGGCCRFLAQYEKRGELSVSGPLRRGGGCCRLLAQYEKGRDAVSGLIRRRVSKMCWRGGANNPARNFLATTPILVFILETETEGGARAP